MVFLFSVSFALALNCCWHLPRYSQSVPHLSQALGSSSVRDKGMVMGSSLITSHPWSLPMGCPTHPHWQVHTPPLGSPEASVSQGLGHPLFLLLYSPQNGEASGVQSALQSLKFQVDFGKRGGPQQSWVSQRYRIFIVVQFSFLANCRLLHWYQRKTIKKKAW